MFVLLHFVEAGLILLEDVLSLCENRCVLGAPCRLSAVICSNQSTADLTCNIDLNMTFPHAYPMTVNSLMNAYIR